MVIQQLCYDAVGTDTGTNNSLLLVLAGPPGLSLDGFSLVGVDGGGGATYRTVALDGFMLASDGLWLLAATNAAANILAVADATLPASTVDMQNGPDSLLLTYGGQTVDALGYGTFQAAQLANFRGESTPALPTQPGGCLTRDANRTDTDDNRADFQVVDAPVLPSRGGAGGSSSSAGTSSASSSMMSSSSSSSTATSAMSSSTSSASSAGASSSTSAGTSSSGPTQAMCSTAADCPSGGGARCVFGLCYAQTLHSGSLSTTYELGGAWVGRNPDGTIQLAMRMTSSGQVAHVALVQPGLAPSFVHTGLAELTGMQVARRPGTTLYPSVTARIQGTRFVASRRASSTIATGSTAGFEAGISVAENAAGDAFVAFTRIVDGACSIHLHTSHADGTAQPLERVAGCQGNRKMLHVHVSSTGEPHVLFVEGAAAPTLYRYRRVNGTWTAEALVPDNPYAAAGYDLLGTRAGDGTSHVILSRILPGGTTYAGRLISLDDTGVTGDTLLPDVTVGFNPWRTLSADTQGNRYIHYKPVTSELTIRLMRVDADGTVLNQVVVPSLVSNPYRAVDVHKTEDGRLLIFNTNTIRAYEVYELVPTTR